MSNKVPLIISSVPIKFVATQFEIQWDVKRRLTSRPINAAIRWCISWVYCINRRRCLDENYAIAAASEIIRETWCCLSKVSKFVYSLSSNAAIFRLCAINRNTYESWRETKGKRERETTQATQRFETAAAADEIYCSAELNRWKICMFLLSHAISWSAFTPRKYQAIEQEWLCDREECFTSQNMFWSRLEVEGIANWSQ